jgi:Family of unknown function (DUF6232)
MEGGLPMERTRGAPQLPVGRVGPPAVPETRTFYRDGAISVTDRWLTTPGRRYAISDLANLRIVRAAAAPVAVASTTMSCVLGLAAATLVVLSGDPALMVGGPLLAVVPFGVALVRWRMRRRFFALYGDLGGRSVQIHGDFDERRFNQVCRALLRAREYRRDHAY